MHQTAKMVVDGKSTPDQTDARRCELPCPPRHEAAAIVFPSLLWHGLLLHEYRPSRRQSSGDGMHAPHAGLHIERCHGRPQTA